jgi:hypothetical protein
MIDNAQTFAIYLAQVETTSLLTEKLSMRHDNKYCRPNLDLPADFTYIEPGFSELVPVSYKKYPIRSIGRENSRHQVHFGTLKFNEGSSLDVAVKDGTLRLSLGEISVMNYYQSLGLKTFIPFAVLKSKQINPEVKETQTYLITRYEDDVRTYNSIDWFRLDDEETRFYLREATLALVELHQNGIIHGDYEIKNIAQDINGKTFAIDWEHSTSYSDVALVALLRHQFTQEQQQSAIRNIEHATRRDLRDLINSISSVLRYRNMSHGRMFKYIRTNILDIYIGALNPNGPYYTVLRTTTKNTISVFKQEFNS